jgi:hypothetical protein
MAHFFIGARVRRFSSRTVIPSRGTNRMNFSCAEQHPVLELVVELEGESHQRVRQAAFHGMQ